MVKFIRVMGHRCLHMVALGALFLSLATAGEGEGGIATDSIDDDLASITPRYQSSPLLPSWSSTGCLPPARLLGFDLRADPTAPQTDPPSYVEGASLALTLFWLPLGPIPSDQKFRIRIAGSGPRYDREFALAPREWRVGVVGKEHITFTHQGGRYSGWATLSVTMRCSEQTDAAELYVGQVYIQPIIAPSNCDNDRLTQVFGNAIVRLNASARLGRWATMTIPVPESGSVEYNGIGLVSSTGYYPHFKKGERICRVELLDTKGDVLQESFVEEGVHTAIEDFDYYPLGALHSERIEMFASKKAEGLGQQNQPYELHDYVGHIPLTSPVRPAFVRVSYLMEFGVLNLREVVLINAPS